MMQIDVAASADPELLRLLAGHPRVEAVEEADVPGIRFRSGPWTRQVVAGDPTIALRGLVELMDNNPVVCADAISVPSPAATLALIALGPLAQAGLIVEPPMFMTSFNADENDVANFLGPLGWGEGVTLSVDPVDLEGVLAATAMAAIRTPEDLDEIDQLYAERFGRSFYVREDSGSPWEVGLVKGRPQATYRLRITPGEDTSLLTIQVMADAHGKCGATQLVHAMNVMSGFEESLGIPA